MLDSFIDVLFSMNKTCEKRYGKKGEVFSKILTILIVIVLALVIGGALPLFVYLLR